MSDRQQYNVVVFSVVRHFITALLSWLFKHKLFFQAVYYELFSVVHEWTVQNDDMWPSEHFDVDELTVIQHDYKPISEMTFRDGCQVCFIGYWSVLTVNRLSRGKHFGFLFVYALFRWTLYVFVFRGGNEHWTLWSEEKGWRQVQVRSRITYLFTNRLAAVTSEGKRERMVKVNKERKFRLQGEMVHVENEKVSELPNLHK